ncbi:aldo/keto reductase [Streptomyces sp. NPDC005917]|uniref:aldo/keto reductase n=1 Tax=unclassified Streptomyces TaxID=2593676 RepID=UPI0033C2F6F7
MAYGTQQFGGGWGPADEQAAVSTIGHARSAGVNFFDTAQAYGFGRSERLFGRALAADHGLLGATTGSASSAQTTGGRTAGRSPGPGSGAIRTSSPRSTRPPPNAASPSPSRRWPGCLPIDRPGRHPRFAYAGPPPGEPRGPRPEAERRGSCRNRRIMAPAMPFGGPTPEDMA